MTNSQIELKQTNKTVNGEKEREYKWKHSKIKVSCTNN